MGLVEVSASSREHYTYTRVRDRRATPRGLNTPPRVHNTIVQTEFVFWNAQTLAPAQAAFLCEGDTEDRAFGLCEFRAQWPTISKLKTQFNVAIATSNEFAWLLPKTWRVWAVSVDLDYVYGIRVATKSGVVMSLYVIHLACDPPLRLTQQAGLEGLDFIGRWVLGGDFNMEREDQGLVERWEAMGARRWCGFAPTHYRDRQQVVCEGYTSHNLDRVWSTLQVEEENIVRTPGMSDHTLVSISVSLDGADSWFARSYKRRVIRADVVARVEPQADLEKWSSMSRVLRRSRDVGWPAFVARLAQEWKNGKQVDHAVHQAA